MPLFKVTIPFGTYECEVEAEDEEDAKIQALASHYTSLHGRIIGWWMGSKNNAGVVEVS